MSEPQPDNICMTSFEQQLACLPRMTHLKGDAHPFFFTIYACIFDRGHQLHFPKGQFIQADTVRAVTLKLKVLYVVYMVFLLLILMGYPCFMFTLTGKHNFLVKMVKGHVQKWVHPPENYNRTLTQLFLVLVKGSWSPYWTIAIKQVELVQSATQPTESLSALMLNTIGYMGKNYMESWENYYVALKGKRIQSDYQIVRSGVEVGKCWRFDNHADCWWLISAGD